MADGDFEEAVPGDRPRPEFDKAARKAERARVHRLSRLPFLFDLADRSPRHAFAASLLQVLLVIVVVLVPAKLLTGRWLPPGVGFAVLGVAFGVQALSRYLNAQAGRR